MTALHHPTALAPEAPAPAQISAPTSDDAFADVKALMLHLAAGERFERLGAIVQEHLFANGKGLRGRLAMATLDALDADPQHRVPWAAACELLHNATLIHDDVQDGDVWRRGRYAVWVRHGKAQAINAGDLLLMLPYIAVEHIDTDDATRWRLSRAIARRAEKTVRGQSHEMSLLGTQQWTWPAYIAAATGKTSALFALPVEGAALLAGRDPTDAQLLADCFEHVGLLFQMQDDVIDLYGDKGRRAPGNDIREGSVTALVVEHLERHPEHEEEVISILARDRDETTDEDVALLTRRFDESGALGAVLERIDRIAQRTLDDPIFDRAPELRPVAEGALDKALAPVEALKIARGGQP